MIQELSNVEIIEINGGHDGAAYNAGKAAREAVEDALFFIACVGYFFMPKS